MNFDSNPTVNKIRYYFSFVMVAVYFAFGLLFFFTDIGADKFPAYRKEIGFTMIVYSIVRLVMSIKKNRNKQRDDI